MTSLLFPLFNVTSSIHRSIMAARGESTRARVRDRKCGYYYWRWTGLAHRASTVWDLTGTGRFSCQVLSSPYMQARQPAEAGGRTWLCRATDEPRPNLWRGRPCHVTGQRPRSSPRHPPAVPPCMAQHRRFTALGKYARTKVLVLGKNSVRFKINL